MMHSTLIAINASINHGTSTKKGIDHEDSAPPAGGNWVGQKDSNLLTIAKGYAQKRC